METISRRAYGRRGPGTRFARATSVEEAKQLVADKKETMVVVEPPKKDGVVPKSKNVNVPTEEEHDVPSLDKFMNLTHQENIATEEANEEPVKSAPTKVTVAPEPAKIEEPAEQVLADDQPEMPVDATVQVFDTKPDEPAQEEVVVAKKTVTEVKPKTVSEVKDTPAKKKASKKKADKKTTPKTEKDKFSDDPLAGDEPVGRARKKKKVVDDPLAD